MKKNQTVKNQRSQKRRRRSWDPKGKEQAQSREQELQKQQMGGDDVVFIILFIIKCMQPIGYDTINIVNTA